MTCFRQGLMALFLLFSAACAQAVLPANRDPYPDRVSLDGPWEILPAGFLPADVYQPGSSAQTSHDWKAIRIPSNWYAEGYDLSGQVWFRKSFKWSATLSGQRALLTFRAVDYAADVWVNGHYAGFHEGYFAPFSMDVTQWLGSGDNLLVVRVDSPDEMPGKAWSLRKNLIKGVLNHHDTRPGGAWEIAGQDANSGGIWGSVWLEMVPPDPIVRLGASLRQGAGDTVRVEVERAGSPITVPLALSLTLSPDNFKGKSFSIDYPVPPESWNPTGRGTYRLAVDVPVSGLQRWWPKGHGAQNLYRLRAMLTGDAVPAVSAERRIGFRTVRLDKDGHAFLINDRRLFLRGTNYIASPWLSTVSSEDYRRDIRMMLDANVNAVRVHAHVAGADFYDRADEEGMLVWQDFPLQWGYSDSEEFLERALIQAREMHEMLDHHPSVFAWCGQNEPPWNAPWMKYKYPEYRPSQNIRLTQRIAEVLAEDETRYVHPFSSTDEHLWMGWYSGNWRDHARKTSVEIVSEFGAQALPGEETFRTIIPQSDWWPKTTDPKDPGWKSWEYRNFQAQETFANAKVQRGDSVRTFIANSQRYQARLVQLAGESYRRQRYQPVAAAFHFLFSETWPSINWGVVDYLRRPKEGYAALRQAFQPILPSIEWDSDKLPAGGTARFVLWSINDTWQAYPDAWLVWRLMRDNGARISGGMMAAPMDADSGLPVKELKYAGLEGGRYRLEAELRIGKKRILGTNSFTFDVEPPKDSFPPKPEPTK